MGRKGGWDENLFRKHTRKPDYPAPPRKGLEEDRLRVVAELTQLALFGASIQRLMDRATEGLARVLEVPLTEILRLEANGRNLRLRAGVGWREGVVGKARVGAEPDSPVQAVLAAREPLLVKNPIHGRFEGERLLREHGVVSGVRVRIAGKEATYGVLGVHSQQRRRFTEGDHLLLCAVANALGLAIENENALRAKAHTPLPVQGVSTEFLSSVSHEIRTVMTTILGYTDLLQQPLRAWGSRRPHLQRIRRSAEHLLTLIHDILDVLKLESGQVGLSSVVCSPLRVTEEVVAALREQMADQEIEVKIDYATPIPQRVDIDPARLRQALFNLAWNVASTADTGEIRIVLHATQGFPGEPAQLCFEVSDPAGRSSRHSEEPDTDRPPTLGGPGLGFAIAQRFSHTLNGEVTFDPTERGRICRLTLPAPVPHGVLWRERPGHTPLPTGRRPTPLPDARVTKPPPEPEMVIKLDVEEPPSQPRVYKPTKEKAKKRALAARKGKPDLRAKRRAGRGRPTILVAEDAADNRELLRHLLDRSGFRVETVADGQSALDSAVEAWRKGKAFDVVLMDMAMPVLDGYDATRGLRQLGYEGSIIAITARALSGDRERCLAAGCDDYVTKPIHIKGLVKCIRKHLAPRPHTAD